MTYLLILIVLAAVVGIGAWAASSASERGRHNGGELGERADEGVTSTDVAPPAHPADPVPGSDAARHEHGSP